MLQKIYIVDDDAITLYLAQVIIEMASPATVCELFENPTEALARLQADAATNNLPDVLLLDLNMPVLSGFDILEQLAPLRNAFEAQRCHVYILTSSISTTDRDNSLACPLVRDVIQKPFSEERLAQVIEAL